MPDFPEEFEVWHKTDEEYKYVAKVYSNATGAILFTTHGFAGIEHWQDQPQVHAAPGTHRSTGIGDVLIDEEGKKLEIVSDDCCLKLTPRDRIDALAPLLTAKWSIESVERQIEFMKEQPEINLESRRYFVQPDPDTWETVYDTCEVLGPWATLNEAEKRLALEEIDWEGVSPEDEERIISREISGDDYDRVLEQASKRGTNKSEGKSR